MPVAKPGDVWMVDSSLIDLRNGWAFELAGLVLLLLLEVGLICHVTRTRLPDLFHIE